MFANETTSGEVIDTIFEVNVSVANNNTKDPFADDIRDSKGIVIVCYSVIVIVSLCGNFLVCKVAFGSKDMRTTTNSLIAVLACSDIVMTAFNIPFNVARLLLLNWPFGSILCYSVPFIQMACVYVSTFTMTVIAVHRYWTVSQKRSTRPSFSAYKLIITVITIFLLAATLSLPHIMFNRVQTIVKFGRTIVRCRPKYPDIGIDISTIWLFLSVEVFLTQYLIPLSITLMVYIKIGFIIAKQGKLIGKLSDERKRRQSEAKRRRIFMLALAVATFATCWFPINFYHLLVDFNVTRHNSIVFIICHWFAMSSVCYNPFIYCWLNEKFRNGAKQTIQNIFHCLHTIFGCKSNRQ